MQTILGILNNIGPVIAGINTVLAGLIAIALILPGTEPEATLQKVVDFLSKFSAK